MPSLPPSTNVPFLVFLSRLSARFLPASSLELELEMLSITAAIGEEDGWLTNSLGWKLFRTWLLRSETFCHFQSLKVAISEGK